MQLPRFARHCVLQGLHQRRIFRDVIVLMADPFGDPDGAVRATADNHANSRRPGISQAAAIHIGYKFWHHLVVLILRTDLSLFHLNDAPISFRRQDDYLILFHGFAVCRIAVHLIVQNPE